MTKAENIQPMAGSETQDIEDEELLAEENWGDLSQNITESYGTGVHDLPGYKESKQVHARDQTLHAADEIWIEDDADPNAEQESIGDEVMGGSVATPEQDVVDEIAAALGVELDDASSLRINDMLEERDDHRWELNPVSSEDYQERKKP